MEQPLLSVIVPVYNLRDYLDRCVSSILGQSWRSLELLLIDDGSSDGSGAMCDAWEQRDNRVRALHQSNQGQAAARNVGLDAATGEWITFVDGDDWINPDMLETLTLLASRNHADIAACAFNYVFADRTGASGSTGLISVLTRDEALERIYEQREVRFETCAKVYRRSAIEGNRFPEGMLYEDLRFMRLALMNAKRYVYIDRPEYQYLQKRPGNTNSSFPEKKLLIIPECDDFASELRREGLTGAAEGMEAFKLEHIMRMSVNAVFCGAEPAVLNRLQTAYRERFYKAKGNPYVRRARGTLFAQWPKLYNRLSERLHTRS